MVPATSILEAPPTRPLFDDGPAPGSVDIRDVGPLFPIKTRRCYLNNGSIAPASLPVLAAMQAFTCDVRDNGRNRYPDWCDYADRTIKARIARLIGAQASEIAFMKNTTEGLVTVANGLAWREGDNVVLPDFEYPSNVYCWMRLKRLGVEIRWVRNQAGRVPVEALAEAIDHRTRLLSVSAVQFSNGFRQDLAATSELCAKRGILLNVDGIQWVGALSLDMADHKIDFMSVGGHKWMLGPIGTGFLYCSRAALDQLDPPSVGYHTVDKGEAHLDYDLTPRPDAGRFEEALVNFPGIWGLDAAVALHLALGPRAVEDHILGLVGQAIEGLRSVGWTIVSPDREVERSGLLSFTRPGLDAEREAARLRDAGIDLAVRGGALRISPSVYNDHEDIGRLVEMLR